MNNSRRYIQCNTDICQ